MKAKINTAKRMIQVDAQMSFTINSFVEALEKKPANQYWKLNYEFREKIWNIFEKNYKINYSTSN